MKTRAHIIVHGIVQGVFFRYRTEQEATGLGLTGWVRNRPDGTVEIMCEGEKEKVGELVRWSHTGPSGASVEWTDVSFEEYTGGFPKFEIRY